MYEDEALKRAQEIDKKFKDGKQGKLAGLIVGLKDVLAYKDREARDAAWKAFGSDAEWAKVKSELQVSSQVESVFMNATDYGPIK